MPKIQVSNGQEQSAVSEYSGAGPAVRGTAAPGACLAAALLLGTILPGLLEGCRQSGRVSMGQTIKNTAHCSHSAYRTLQPFMHMEVMIHRQQLKPMECSHLHCSRALHQAEGAALLVTDP